MRLTEFAAETVDDIDELGKQGVHQHRVKTLPSYLSPGTRPCNEHLILLSVLPSRIQHSYPAELSVSCSQMPLPILDLSLSQDPEKKGPLLDSLRDALFNVGFLYVRNHGVSQETIDALTKRIPGLFDLPEAEKAKLSKINSPHFLGYSGYADEETQGRRDLREQFDFATEVPVVYDTQTDAHLSGRDFSKLYWRLRGPNQWPSEDAMPGFWKALLA